MPNEEYKFTYSDVHIALDPCFPLDMITWKVSRDPISELHHHDCYEIGICFDGFGLYVLGGKVYTYQKGDIVAVGPNIYHRAHTESTENDLWSFIFFNPKDWTDNNLSENLNIIIPESENKFLHDLVEQMYLEMRQIRTGSKGIAGGCISTIIPLLEREDEKRSKGQKINSLSNIDFRLHSAINLLMEKENLNISVQELAAKCNISVSYLRELFNKQIGMSPKEFQTEVRMKRALSLIRCTNLRMMDIALECGYNTISSFNKQFYERYKISPFQMKKKNI